MSSRYMDFVPAKAKKEIVVQKTKVEPKVRTEVATPQVKTASRVAAPKMVTPKATMPRRVATKKGEPELGVIEDLGTTFEESRVSRSHFNEEEEGIRAAKAKKVGLREDTEDSKYKASGLTTKNKTNEEIYKTPKTPFINQDKVVKRPLSKNVYQKKVVVPKEEPKGPVTIITKPEKQAHVSLIVTIILTIILGAAAGTVAFLLLPK